MNSNSERLVPRFFLLLFGVMLGSTAVILIKASTEHPFLVAAFRLLVAAFVLSPFFWRDLRNYDGKYGWKQLSWTFLPAAALAVHFMSWVIGARMTMVANASLIINLTPVAMPFFVWIFFNEGITRKETLGTGLTIIGLFVMLGSNFQLSKTDFTGDLICFGSMLTFAMYLALGRKNGGRISLWLYMVPLYFVAGLICLVCALFVTNPIKTYSLSNILYIVGLGVVPTVFGHTILNYSLKFFRGQVVSVTNLSQPLFAGIMAFAFWGEKPQPVFYAAAALIIAGILVVLNASRQHAFRGRAATSNA
jgi:drug/metabolite transporter (DMT)-like permease